MSLFSSHIKLVFSGWLAWALQIVIDENIVESIIIIQNRIIKLRRSIVTQGEFHRLIKQMNVFF